MIKIIITDIEGTTSSISFVKDVLFPYARAHISDFVLAREHEPHIKKLLKDVCDVTGETLSTADIIKQLIQWIDEDQKITALKALQGLIWEAGYQKGDFNGHLYDDALENLQKWHAQGIQLYVYSSGSVYAQKLLFSHTIAGDLTPIFSDYFDTQIGNKKEVQSYQAIIASINAPANEMLFLSDAVEELDAAKQAGLHTICLNRDNSQHSDLAHFQVTNFNDIELKHYE